MTLAQFRNLPFALQAGLLLRSGIPLLSRSVGTEHRVLFSLHTYFVEVGWDANGELQFVHSFQHTDGLETYLNLLDWHELA